MLGPGSAGGSQVTAIEAVACEANPRYPAVMKTLRLEQVTFGLIIAATLPQMAVAAGALEEKLPGPEGRVILHPIRHATMVLRHGGHVVYVDPVGGAGAFEGLPRPTLVLITHIHGDHLSVDTLRGVVTRQTRLVAPSSVIAQLPPDLAARTTRMDANQEAEVAGLKIRTIPAYNLTPERLRYHPKGRDVGYILRLGGLNIYISGDTEDIPEMRALKDIDVAFVCMNLPYTMTVEQAASAVRAFKPKRVYPYHYRGSDLERFRQLVGADAGVEVRLLDWYAGR